MSNHLLERSTIQLLRFHFSFFLLPVYLFAVSQVPHVQVTNAILVFFILHVLVYPASNGYNSYMDRDEGPIGGLKDPMQPTRQLFYVTIAMDIAAVLLSLFIDIPFACGVLLYILASRAYSWRKIRLKQFPVIGFLTVFFFQGAFTFFISYHGVSGGATLDSWIKPLIASLLIGALYPLTQVYQHEDDAKDGVITISMLVGKRGSFVFSAALFILSAFLFWLLFRNNGQEKIFYIYLLTTFPIVCYFLYWAIRVWKNENEANFRNSLLMSMVATVFTSIFFILLIILNH
jgi:1,4-dihydroxy-2-naphthoate polyprenyltransferase